MDKRIRIIEVVPYDPDWKIAFHKAKEEIIQVLGTEVISINHIGSTAIPDIYAKPIIDILVGVKVISVVDNYNEEMSKIGYIAKGEYGIDGRRYFIKGDSYTTHHIHIFQEDDPQIERHINFRDYMISHPDEAKKYEELKKELAEQYKNDANSYVSGKSAFIQNIDQKASLWRKSQRSGNFI